MYSGPREGERDTEKGSFNEFYEQSEKIFLYKAP